jgi:mRNA-degrading endonuclease RelE of RelBE toxin-antitoxin system
MANIYIKDKTNQLLKRLAKKENRGIKDEIDFLCEKRMRFLEPQVEKPENDKTS